MKNDIDWAFEVMGVEKVTDGDTFWLRLDVGFRQQQLTHLRLADFDTPELYRPQNEFEKEKAREARYFVSTWLDQMLDAEGVEVWCMTQKDPDSFGRWLGELVAFDEDGVRVSHLGEALQEADLAVQWPTKWRDRFPG